MAELAFLTLEQTRALWHDYLRRQQTPMLNNGSQVRVTDYQAPIAVIIDEALDAASDSKTGATSGLATRCNWNAEDEEYVEADSDVDQVTVWNHSESDSYDADTFGFAHWIDGHWVFLGDCAAMASR
jgi:hypothetical protein